MKGWALRIGLGSILLPAPLAVGAQQVGYLEPPE